MMYRTFCALNCGKLRRENAALREEIEELYEVFSDLQQENADLQEYIERLIKNIPANIIPDWV